MLQLSLLEPTALARSANAQRASLRTVTVRYERGRVLHEAGGPAGDERWFVHQRGGLRVRRGGSYTNEEGLRMRSSLPKQ
jgi:hypothetical protein